ncbi:MAG TPA: MBL fold metallo-hydrolase, partial [archaeon]|nr:MBL fold metallo-hydrolase [archaeon]
DLVLLSHDHHFDNLDHTGRAVLAHVEKVLTTPFSAERLGGNAVGLAPWQTFDLPTRDGRILRVTGTPARHGPVGGERGPVTGFVLTREDGLDGAIYISGDTVWYDGVAEVARRFPVRTAVLFMGAARVREVGPHHVTMIAHPGRRNRRPRATRSPKTHPCAKWPRAHQHNPCVHLRPPP